MTRICFDEKNLSMSFEGHAGAGERGSDLVCAGVSTLMGTLRAMCELFEELKAETQVGEVSVKIRLHPDKGYEGSGKLIMQTIFAGCCLLAKEDAENVEVREAGENAGNE